jgi:CRISPR system Cascade subunit CasD
MSTLVAQLAGPVQAWGAEPRLRTATTHTTPTWSGLLGLARAALGHGRTDPPDDVAWLRELDMAVRVDAPGSTHMDFHTINPLPTAYNQFAFVDPGDRGLVPVGTELQKSGQAPRWLKGAAPMVTRRQLLHDASFLWLASGPEASLQRLAEALNSPRWAIALGRKSCTPASPLLLGIHPGTLVDAAVSVPLTGRTRHFARPEEAVTVPLIWVHGSADPTPHRRHPRRTGSAPGEPPTGRLRRWPAHDHRDTSTGSIRRVAVLGRTAPTPPSAQHHYWK